MRLTLVALFLVLGSLLLLPTQSFSTQVDAQWGWTDEDFDYLGSDTGDLGPRSITPVLIKGVLSHKMKTITNTFVEDLGVVTIQIEDMFGKIYISKTVDSSVENSTVIDISALPMQSYKIICTFEMGERTAEITLR